jgi:predicted AAA+ superfamily ATPase
MNETEELKLKMQTLVLFRPMLNDPVVSKFITLLGSVGRTTEEQVNAYCAFASELYQNTDNWSEYLLGLLLRCETPYLKAKAKGQPISELMQLCLDNELDLLSRAARITSAELRAMLDYFDYLPDWKTERFDFAEYYTQRIAELPMRGFGVFSEYAFFTSEGGVLQSVVSPDPIRLSELKEYQAERKTVIENTVALLDGKPAANVLLYGDAGTGKSSTVKAIVNEYAERGLRLIEVKKECLNDIPSILQQIDGNPLKFILFIDDLSFEREHDQFNSLKAVLEGSVAAKPSNLIVYVTSNRRHMIKESASDRAGDDMHRNETIQEMTSLSDRFGLSVGFFSA